MRRNTRLALLSGALLAQVASAETRTCVPRKSAEAWFTGPMLANTAATLPRGHVAVETYLYDVSVQGAFDRDGRRHSTTHANSFGTLTYAVYGLRDRLSVGFVPTASLNTVSGGPNSSGVGLGEVGMLAQYGLTRANPCNALPSIAMSIQETFPTGKYDLLGNRPTDGIGSGAYTTALSVYSQKPFVLPNGRLFRMRFNVTQAFNGSATIRDVSVYGTDTGFRGAARPGAWTFVNAAWEYSVTRSWVLALDATYRHTGNTRVSGVDSLSGVRRELNSGTSDAFALAPAIEYSWSPSWGVLLGTRFIPAGRNTSTSITPALAVNFVR
jgi:hypothetical protein